MLMRTKNYIEKTSNERGNHYEKGSTQTVSHRGSDAEAVV